VKGARRSSGACQLSSRDRHDHRLALRPRRQSVPRFWCPVPRGDTPNAGELAHPAFRGRAGRRCQVALRRLAWARSEHHEPRHSLPSRESRRADGRQSAPNETDVAMPASTG
jgi:hypothetical protein